MSRKQYRLIKQNFKAHETYGQHVNYDTKLLKARNKNFQPESRRAQMLKSGQFASLDVISPWSTHCHNKKSQLYACRLYFDAVSSGTVILFYFVHIITGPELFGTSVPSNAANKQ
jgi:hypothetical protein